MTDTNQLDSYPKKVLAWIMAQIESGKTVYITTMTKSIPITPKTIIAWEKSGRKLFKIDGDGLRIAAGKRYDLITSNTMAFCKISAI